MCMNKLGKHWAGAIQRDALALSEIYSILLFTQAHLLYNVRVSTLDIAACILKITGTDRLSE